MEQELRDKISLAMKEDFVGNYVFTDNELTSITNDAGCILRRIEGERGANISSQDFELIFVALVNIAKEWHTREDAFFSFVFRRLVGYVSNEEKIRKQIVRIIDKLNASKKIFMLPCYVKKYYATLCSHSFAPLSSTESFFNMCWEIYCKDLDQQYEENDPSFKLIANSLKRKFSSSRENYEEDFEVGSKVYSFRVGIRGLAIDQPELITELLDETMGAIHSLFNNEPLRIDKYIKVLINTWWKGKESEFGCEKRRSNSSKEHICTDYSQIRPKYVLKDGIAKLVIPSIRLRDSDEYSPYIEIFLNDVSFKRDKMTTFGSGIIMSTTAIEYDLSIFEFESILDIKIEITNGDEVIYKSKDSLKREFILFSDSRETLSLDCIPGIYFLYIKNINYLLKYPEDIHKTKFNTYSLEARVGDIIQSHNKSVFFVNDKSDRDLYFFAKEHNDVIFRSGDEESQVIEGELYIDVNENTDIKDFGVKYESTVFKLSDFQQEIINGKRRFLISSLLDVGETQHISIFRYSDNVVVASKNFIKFNNIRITFDKSLYYGKGDFGVAKFTTDKYEVERQFDIKNKEISLPLEDGEIILCPPVLRWRIDDGEWHSEQNQKRMWYKEITNSSIITINIPKSMTCTVLLYTNINTNISIEQSGNGLAYKIGQTIYALKNNISSSLKSFKLFIKVEKESYPISDIFHRECFVEDPVFILSKMKQAFWQPETFIGDDDAKLRFDVFNQLNKRVFSKELTLSKQSFILTNIEEGYYTYKISLLCRDFLNTERELYSQKFVLGDEKNIKYKNKVLKITKAAIFDKPMPVTIRPIYIENVEYLGEKDNFDFYSGRLFIVDRYEKRKYPKSVKNEPAGLVKINPVRIEIKSESSCYLGYGLCPDDEEFEFEGEFSLNGQGKMAIGSISKGQKTRGIDYFLFEVMNNV